jgi:hypothetical protein
MTFPLSLSRLIVWAAFGVRLMRMMLTAPRQFKAAQFLRLAESKGNKTLGNTW